MTDTALRMLIRAVNRIARGLPDERRQWIEALTAETVAVPGRWARLGWVLGGLAVVANPVFAREVSRMRPYVWLVPAVLVVPAVLAPSVGPVPLVVTVLFGLGGAALLRRRASGGRAPVAAPVAVVGGVAAVAVLTAVVVRRYPQAAAGAGAPLYGSVLALLLAGYVLATVLLSRTGPDVARYALVGGLVSAALWTLGIPAGVAVPRLPRLAGRALRRRSHRGVPRPAAARRRVRGRPHRRRRVWHPRWRRHRHVRRPGQPRRRHGARVGPA